MSAAPAPYYFVTAETPPKISLVQSIKNRAQIEMRTLVLQIQLPLHRKVRLRQIPPCFRLLCHLPDPQNEQVDITLVVFDRVTRKVVRFARKICKQVNPNHLYRSGCSKHSRSIISTTCEAYNAITPHCLALGNNGF